MATIQSTISLNDNFTNVLNNVIDAVNSAIYTVEEMQSTMGSQIDNGAFESMRSDIDSANAALDEMSQNLQMTSEISADTAGQQQFNTEIENGASSAGNLKGMIAGAVSAYAGIAGIRKATSFVKDSMSSFNDQLNAETQLATVLGNTIEDDVGGAFDTIKAKASEIQSNGIYGDEAMIAAAGEFATYFSDTDAITTMMDTLSDYAMGMSGGGEIDQSAMVDYATNLGKIMSGSYDAMTKKGFEFTDAQKAIIEGTASEAEIVATLGDEYVGMSEDMQAAAAISQVIEGDWANLYSTMSDTPEGKIIQLTNAFGDLKESLAGGVYPYIIRIVDIINANWETIQSIMNGFGNAINVVVGILGTLLNVTMTVVSFFVNNWSLIKPIIMGIAAALLIYTGYLVAHNAVQTVSNTLKTLAAIVAVAHGEATAKEKAETVRMSEAQLALNASLLACPITWIIAGIIALIAVIYLVVAAINKFADTSISATGVIAGVFNVLLAFLKNNFVVPLWNAFADVVNFIGNAFNNPVAAIKVLFYDMCLTVIGYIQRMASAIETLINKIPGVTVDITSGLDNFYSGLEQAQQAAKDESGWTEYVSKMERTSYSDAYANGYNWGSNLSLSGIFGTEDITSVEDWLADYEYDDTNIANTLDSIADNTGSTAGSADNIASSLDVTEQELKYLRDIAEQETVNRYTTAEITIQQTNNNSVSGSMDLDGIVSGLTDAVNEAVEIVTEGVHT